MSKFLTGKNLEKTIYDIIWNAKETLLIVSPYIKLDDYFKKLFDKHINNPKLRIIIVFGKNEGNVKRSLNKQDFEYFKKFLNISIIYVPELHAKYYATEKRGIITSINLYDYSFTNNIEFGVYTEQNIINSIKTSIDVEAWQTSRRIAYNNEAVFIKRPVYERKLLGKNYIKSDVLHDTTDKFYSHLESKSNTIKYINDFPYEIKLGSISAPMPFREDNEYGYCIRTGKKIPFNPQRPFCETAYISWAKYMNMDYPEKYCHKTGKLSYGKTSMRHPIL